METSSFALCNYHVAIIMVFWTSRALASKALIQTSYFFISKHTAGYSRNHLLTSL